MALAATAFLGAATLANAADEPYDALPYTPSLDVSAMDRTADPCEDLYTYACGGWKKNNPIPPDQNRWSVYAKLSVDNQRYLWGILEDAAKPASGRTPTQQKIGDYFAACMNEEAIERAGLGPDRAGSREDCRTRGSAGTRETTRRAASARLGRRNVLRQRCPAGRA